MANKYNFKLINDNCHALGAKINDNMVGLNGTVGIFSFYVTKLMTSGGQGGMLISKNKEYADAARDYREFDLRNDNKKRFNFQMTDLQAAIGREQLKKLPSLIKDQAGKKASEKTSEIYHKIEDISVMFNVKQNQFAINYKQTNNPE